MMDYCSIDSEVIESLDYLRPPVKRLKYPIRDKLHYSHNYNPNDIKILHSHRKRVANYENSYTNNQAVGSSTSLILQKTSEINILEKYSIVSYTDIQRSNENPITRNTFTEKNITDKNKPLIKVTVIPKTDDPQAKLMRKRRKTINRVQTTVSNQENSIQTKNVYLVVAGHRKEKVYELKTTESAKFSNDHADLHSKDEELSVKELPNFKYFINSLNMDKKKKKNRKKKEQNEAIANRESDDVGDMGKESFGPNTRDLEPHKSHVTIYGRVGLTEDDRYVMDCSATVNNRPVPSENFVKVERTSSRILLGLNRKEQKFHTNFKQAGRMASNRIDFHTRSSLVQADFPDDITCYKLMDRNPFDRNPMRSKESQSTQVDFHINLSNNVDSVMKSSQIKDDSGQCKCKNLEQSDDKGENKNLKESHSPFVIISVYPKPDSLDMTKPIKPNPGDISNRRSQQKNKEINNNFGVKERPKIKKEIEIKTNTRSPRSSRSPSPSPKPEIKKPDSKPRKTNTALKETGRRRAMSPPERSQQNNFNPKTNSKKKLLPPEASTNIYRQLTHPSSQISSKSFEDKGTNTDHLLAKKALVDQYTEQLTCQMKKFNRSMPNNSPASNNTSSTYGENERFFSYGKKKGRMMSNDSPPRKNQDEIGSMENFLIISDNTPQGHRTPSETRNDWPNDDLLTKTQVSRIHVRDSLEICHRREDSSGLHFKDTQTSYDNRNASNDTKYFAPIKHYTGDKCAIPNPVARDKEIRQLLGVNKGRSTPTRTQMLQTNTHRQPNPVKCYYQATSDNNILQEITVMECPCKCCVHEDKQNTCRPKEKPHEKDENIQSVKRITETQNENGQQDRTLYQQMVLNRNIQVFLQVEQCTKQKPIVLSRKQYDKVKRTIEETISRTQNKRKCYINKNSIVSVGEVRRKSNLDRNHKHSKKAQTNISEIPECFTQKSSCAECFKGMQNDKPKKQKFSTIATPGNSSTEISVDLRKHKHHSKRIKLHDKNKSSRPDKKLICIYTGSCRNKCESGLRQAVSSMEIRYASISYLKHITFSSTNVPSSSIPLTYTRNDSSSIYTIFKGHRKSPTPNLGTSAFSLYSETNPDTKILKILMPPRDPKPKKPFLKRLMSCLVMRSTRASDVKTCLTAAPLDPSANSSVDSYHFSTSLGAVEISSSLYDTSASFYSSHSIHPITSKMKRGFFSSVRGFLNRKS